MEMKSGETDIGLAFLKMDGGSILCYDFSVLEDQYFDKIEAVNIMKEETKSKEMDMLNGGLAGKLILFAIPLALSSILQQLFISADVAVVGRFAGNQALAAVGSCVALVGIFVNLIVGLSVGPNAALANLIGQRRRDGINRMLHTILTFAVISGIVLMGLGLLSARVVLKASGTPDTVLGTVVFRMIWLVTIFRLVPTFDMLMNVYVASWIFTGGAIFIVYRRHMRKLEQVHQTV